MPPAKVKADPTVFVAEAMVITVLEAMFEITLVSLVAVIVMLSPILKVFKNVVPVPVQVVFPVIVTVPIPAVPLAICNMAEGLVVPMPTLPLVIILIAEAPAPFLNSV